MGMRVESENKRQIAADGTIFEVLDDGTIKRIGKLSPDGRFEPFGGEKIWNCPNCGRKDIESNFCPDCGTRKQEADKILDEKRIKLVEILKKLESKKIFEEKKRNMSNEAWNCPNCGKQEVTSKFCPDCGTKKPESLIWNCPNCGRKEIESKFCPNCGTKKPEAKKGLTPEEMATERARIREALLSHGFPERMPLVGKNEVVPAYIDRGDYLELTVPVDNIRMIEKNSSPTYMGWEQAAQYAKNLRKGGFSDWRVPTKEELKIIYGIKDVCEIDKNDSWFWSSTPDEDPEFLWVMNFEDGYETINHIEWGCFVRCVR